jgi:N,N'-diacetyllegionaminate synthase
MPLPSSSALSPSALPLWEGRFNPDAPCRLIAEVGVNHNGHMAWAKQLIEAAAQAGADAVKFQLFLPEALASADAPLAPYQQQALTQQAPKTQQAMLKELALTVAQMQELKQHADACGILFLCTPFDEASTLALLHEFDLPFLKFGSGDLTTLPLLKLAAARRKPMLLSTGMATLAEVQEVAAYLQPFYGEAFATSLSWMHCVSSYPAPLESLNLKALLTLQQAFSGHVVGYSDHSLGLEAMLMSVALGAKLIEKHITLDVTLPGPDHAASLPVSDLPAFVQALRQAEVMLGTGEKRPHPCEEEVRRVARKSLVVKYALPAAHVLQEADLLCQRPAFGLSPLSLPSLLGKALKQGLPQGHLLTLSDLL